MAAMGSAKAARVSAPSGFSVAATAAAADARTADRGLLGDIGALHRPHHAGRGVHRHLRAREVAALVRCHLRAAGGCEAERHEERKPHGASASSFSTWLASSSVVDLV